MITGHFVDAYLPILDGVIRTTQAFQEHMGRSLGPSYVIAPSHPGYRERDPRVERYFSVPFRQPYRIGLPMLDPTLRRRLAPIPFDIIHAHGPFGSGLLARKHARARDCPLVFTLWSRFPEWVAHQYKKTPAFAAFMALDAITRRPIAHRLQWRDALAYSDRGLTFSRQAMCRQVWDYASQTDCVIVLSEASRRELLEYREACPPSERARSPRIEVVRQGIDFPHVAAGSNVRARFGIANDVPLFLYVGQMAYEKEIPFLLESLARLQAKGREFHMLFVGEGPYQRVFEQQAAALGIGGACTFAGVIAAKDELADFYAQSDLFLFPSLYETQGLVAMEAASFGLPMVAQKDAPGLSEIFSDQTAFSAERSPEAFAALVDELCANLQRAKDVGARAERCVVRMEKTVAEVSAIYAELTRKKVRRG